MIAVIADDLSGACEIAGAAANRGLRAEVHTHFDPDTIADIVVVDTDTRSIGPAEAAKIVRDVTLDVLRTRPSWIYKKTDSVLRGNVRVEIEAMLSCTGQARAVLIPANPTRGRVIRNGHYYIDGTPLERTQLAQDPEYRRHTSSVRDLLGETPSIDTPDAADTAAITGHAGRVNDATLPAGGVDFFDSLLEGRGISTISAPEMPFAPGLSLFVCGSAAAWRLGREAECRQRSIPVTVMPAALLASPGDVTTMTKWADDLLPALVRSGTAMMAIGRHESLTGVNPAELVGAISQAVVHLMSRAVLSRIFLEGGATAAAFIQRQRWTKLLAHPYPARGVATLSPVVGGTPLEQILLIKPGSYPWPDPVWRGLSTCA